MDFTAGSSGSSSSREEEKVSLIIRDETKNDTVTIDFRVSTSVRGVKEDISHVTDIPVRFQVWTGWPEGTTDIMVSFVLIIYF